MHINDAEDDLDRELARLKLRDIVIGSAVAAVLLAMIPGHPRRGVHHGRTRPRIDPTSAETQTGLRETQY